MKPKNIAIFASGSGTNAEKIINYFKNSQIGEVKLILSNNPDAYVLERARNHQIPWICFSRSAFYDTDKVLQDLQHHAIDFIVLAGFLWLVPVSVLQEYEDKIINIHPALLPKYGGKGMYGEKVHRKVIENQEKESGITIHLVNENYDEGQIIRQVKCKVDPEDTPETLANKIHQLEYQYFPKVIEELLSK